METKDIRQVYRAVCETPSGVGFSIDHMPYFLYKGEIDDGTPHVHTLHLDGLKPSHRLFVQFRRMLEKDYATKHTVQEYADALNVAVRTLNKCVNECSGRSPLTFITERIMLEAKRQVRYSHLMIKEIAFNLGYDDPSYFVKLFKRQTGMLPSDFREMEEVSRGSCPTV